MNEETKKALSSVTTGLYILTTGTLAEPHGMIVSWASQVGFDPALVMVAVRQNRFLHDLIPRFGCFGLNVLPPGLEDFLPFFKKASPEEKFRRLDLFTAVTGAPLVRQALACLDCRLAETIRPGDHTLFLGRVEEGRQLGEGSPMTSLDYGHVYLGQS
ncbi:MAG: flavin reductase [Deltaproteobacteria bacterium]|nr:flavin reductase [Deltaproteobacteria bacterium]